MDAAATSAVPQLNGLDDILQSSPRDQLVLSRNGVISTAIVNVSLVQSSAHTQVYEINFMESSADVLPPS